MRSRVPKSRYENHPWKGIEIVRGSAPKIVRTSVLYPPEFSSKIRQKSPANFVKILAKKARETFFQAVGHLRFQTPLFVLKKSVQTIQILLHGVRTIGVQVGVRNLDPKLFLASGSIGTHPSGRDDIGLRAPKFECPAESRRFRWVFALNCIHGGRQAALNRLDANFHLTST